jgi:serine/threonine protein kinase
VRVSQRNTPDGIDTEVLNYSKPFERIMTGSAVAPALRIPDYELLQLVGRGSYGEVWMAHNALGSLRAVKVVWRKNFEDERPYEREFRGIRKFEPVSRKHEGLIDLYHVGRNNDEG